MQSIPIGATGSFSLVVMPEHLASRFKDVTLPPVLATPVMIMVMENAALERDQALSRRRRKRARHARRRAPSGSDAAGSPRHWRSDSDSRLMGDASSFRFARPKETRRLESGTHERMVVQLSRLAERMKAKFG